MKYTEVEMLLERVRRLSARLAERASDRFEWDYTFDDGETHKYVIEGLKPPDLILDDLTSAFVWLWSLKDHLKEVERAEGRDPTWVEEFINADIALPVCGDIANSAKHGKLKKTRSKTYARLGQPRYDVPQEAMDQISFRAFQVGLKVKRPELVEVQVPVQDHKGGVLGDGFEYLAEGVLSWERVLARKQLVSSEGLAP